MLSETFIHIPGIGPETEQALWTQGCSGWADFVKEPARFSCGSVDRKQMLAAINRSVKAVGTRDHRYFGRALGTKHSWRAFPEFRDRCVYLDIETDGRSSGDAITTIGLYDGETFRCLIKYQNLEEFPEVISNYGMIVTFYGAGFDLPMLQRRFPGLRFDHIHLDLCVALKKLGLRGGLKSIERQLGITRGAQSEGLNGLDAIRLWRRYDDLDDEAALETLIAYNREDVVNLESLAEYAYGRLWSTTRQPRLDLN